MSETSPPRMPGFFGWDTTDDPFGKRKHKPEIGGWINAAYVGQNATPHYFYTPRLADWITALAAVIGQSGSSSSSGSVDMGPVLAAIEVLQQGINAMSGSVDDSTAKILADNQKIKDDVAGIAGVISTVATNMAGLKQQIADLQAQLTVGTTVTQTQVDALAAAAADSDAAVASADALKAAADAMVAPAPAPAPDPAPTPDPAPPVDPNPPVVPDAP